MHNLCCGKCSKPTYQYVQAKYWASGLSLDINEREDKLRKLSFNSSFCAVTADSKLRWWHERKAHFHCVLLVSALVCHVTVTMIVDIHVKLLWLGLQEEQKQKQNRTKTETATGNGGSTTNPVVGITQIMLSDQHDFRAIFRYLSSYICPLQNPRPAPLKFSKPRPNPFRYLGLCMRVSLLSETRTNFFVTWVTLHWVTASYGQPRFMTKNICAIFYL